MQLSKAAREHRNKLKKIAWNMSKRNDRFFPPVPPVIDCMSFMLDREEVDYLVQIELREYTYKELLALSQKTSEKFNDFLKTLQKKGFLEVNLTAKGEEIWGLSPIAVGWLEGAAFYYMGTPEEKVFYKMLYCDVFDYMKKINKGPLRTLVNKSVTIMNNHRLLKANQVILPFPAAENKIIPVDKTLGPPSYEIYPRKTILELVEERSEKEAIYTYPCACRIMKAKSTGETCVYGLKPEDDSCLLFTDRGIGYSFNQAYPGKKVSKQEALDILYRTGKKGSLHNVYHEKDDIGNRSEVIICNCCADCCGLFRGYNSGCLPIVVRSLYFSRMINPEGCVGCNKCIKHCPTQAITGHNGTVKVNKNRCVGCAQCVIQCPGNKVFTMVPEERDVVLPMLEPSERRFEVTPMEN